MTRIRRRPAVLLSAAAASVVAAGAAAAYFFLLAPDAAVAFRQSKLAVTGGSVDQPSTLQFGPDGRLYVSEYFGEVDLANPNSGVIKVLEVARNAGGYEGRMVGQIRLLPEILNHNDDGTPRPDLVGRLITGLTVIADPQRPNEPVIYATSTDPRTSKAIKGTPTNDTDLDTNSGILSRLSRTRDADGKLRLDPDGRPAWEKVDLVRGLPRSEERHNVNGVVVVEEGGRRYALISVAGNTNAGAPARIFGFLPDYAYSGTIVRVDLDAVEALPTRSDATSTAYKYDLPTVDDPTRPGDEDAAGGPFGGNDGRNMARILSDGHGRQVGPVTVHATGVRNGYDLTLTTAGQVFTFDNGGNPGNGGGPIVETIDGRTVYTNRPAPDAVSTTNEDQLHLIEAGGHYGHPNPLRASGAAAGLYVGPNNTAVELPADLESAVPADLRGPGRLFDPAQQGAFLGERYNGFPWNTGAKDDVVLSSKSTNGIVEYTSAVGFGGTVRGDLFAVRWGTKSSELVHIDLVDADGDGRAEAADKAGSGNLNLSATFPLDVTAWRQDRDGDAVHPLAGTLWVAAQAGSGAGVWVLTPDRLTPPAIDDFDGDKIADLKDPDDDNDGLGDARDPFAYDPTNGATARLDAGGELVWEFAADSAAASFPGGREGYRAGLTGVMTNGVDSPEALSFDRWDGDQVIPGAAGDALVIGNVPGGGGLDARGTTNKQAHGLQAGFLPAASAITLEAVIANPFAAPAFAGGVGVRNQGIYIGLDQDRYVKVVVGSDGGPADAFVEVLHEFVDAGGAVADVPARYPDADLRKVNAADVVRLFLDVNTAAGMATPRWEFTTEGGAGPTKRGQGAPVPLDGALLEALKGQRRLATDQPAGADRVVGAAWGVIAFSSDRPFPAAWDRVAVTAPVKSAASAAAP